MSGWQHYHIQLDFRLGVPADIISSIPTEPRLKLNDVIIHKLACQHGQHHLCIALGTQVCHESPLPRQLELMPSPAQARACRGRALQHLLHSTLPISCRPQVYRLCAVHAL